MDEFQRIDIAVRNVCRQIDQAIASKLSTYSMHGFNLWFRSDMIEAYVRQVERIFPPELFHLIKGDDERNHVCAYGGFRVKTLELANFNVLPEFHNKKAATWLITRMAGLAHSHGFYFMLENVISPHLMDSLNKKQEFVAWTDEFGVFTSFYRKFEAVSPKEPEVEASHFRSSV